jgi:G:T-mismatch repair DNA endonuclease (very short patch repair protein)
MSKCNLCDFESDSEIKLSKHIQHTHKLKKTDYLIQTKYNGTHPLCECGCNQETRYEASKLDFCRFISGHQSRLEGYWGDLKSEKRVNAIINTRKQKFQSGEYDHILNQVSKPRSEEIKQKISKSGTGVSRPEADGFGIGRIHSQQTKDKMSETAKDKWITGDIGKRKYYTSKLEKTFANILDLLDIKYEILFYAKDIKAFYDFYIPEYNMIIEVDGDFWHCNPDRFPIPQYESQKKNLIRDKEKNKWAVNNGYKIIRIWENDIKNNIPQVKQILLNCCK